MNVSSWIRCCLLGGLSGAALLLAGSTFAADHVSGQVTIGGASLARSTVTLWDASSSAPKKVAETKTNNDGKFELRGSAHADSILYLVAAGGTLKGKGDNPGLVLLLVLGNNPPEKVVVNELTTVASAFTAARFINGEGISGNPLGLRIAAGNVPNLVNPTTGGWGNVLLDPINSTQTATLSTLDTLGSLITAFATVGNDDWRGRFFKSAIPSAGTTPKNTLEAMAGIAREPWADPKAIYGLFDEAYPQPKDGSRRAAPFVPYLAWAPPDFALSLCFAGGGVYSAGRLMFDKDANLWSGQNWLAGSQSGVIHSIGGGVVKLTPNGTPLSPPITGFTGMGIDGVGWGTAVTNDKVWASSFNGKFVVMDFDGRPAAKETAIDIPWGLNIDGNDDVWVGNFKGRSVVLMAGAEPKGRSANAKPGDVLHVFTGGSIQMLTDVSIDPAGNVWAANNWNAPEGAAGDPPAYPASTWGGGSGVTVIYGVAAPVKPPRMGKVRTY
jgi:hypothetical protein